MEKQMEITQEEYDRYLQSQIGQLCEKHKKTIRSGKWGNWCPTKDEYGRWCTGNSLQNIRIVVKK